MGLFGTNKKEVKKGELPVLPALPRLPDFPGLEDEDRTISKLPSFPYNNLGTKFSQNTIKEAVKGKEENNEFFDPDDFDLEDDDETRVMQEPIRKPFTKEFGREFSNQKFETRNGTEPVFIRIDKFEDAMDVFDGTKRKLSEIERILENIRKIREKEEMDLQAWEKEIRTMKEQIEKVDRNIFSKI